MRREKQWWNSNIFSPNSPKSFLSKIRRKLRVCLDRTYFADWKHCSKIIFKCVNSDVGPFLMKKLLKRGICGSMNSAQMHCSLWKSQHLRLLFMKQCMNSNRIPWNAWKPKKKKRKTQNVQTSKRNALSKHHLKGKNLTANYKNA